MTVATSIIPPVQQALDELIARYVTVRDGEVASYIPELARADPEPFGIAVIALNGNSYAAGDSETPFTIQSISKPLMYGLALEANGEEAVLKKVGLEPTGDSFNAISFDPNGRPFNPMINAGAIATASMVSGAYDNPVEQMLEMFRRYTGHKVQVDEAVFESESETGHRNRAIGHMLRNFGIVTVAPDDALDLYFRQCSVTVNCRDLALMAACLANSGVNPITGERALDSRYADRVLSVMGTCGMYDYAGEWIYRVGIPAKSGVAGGVLAVLPGQLGIGVFSPRLDARGNSVRGVLVCRDLSSKYKLHILNVPNVAQTSVRASHDLTVAHSKRRRRPEMDEALREGGHRAQVRELQGDLNFASADAFTRDIVDRADEIDYLAIDFRRADRIDGGAATLLGDMIASLLGAGKIVVLSDSEHHPELAAVVETLKPGQSHLKLADNLDRAIEVCEDLVIEAAGLSSVAMSVALEQNAFFEGLSLRAIEALCAIATEGEAAPGQKMVSRGDPATGVFLLTSGEVSVTVDLAGGEHVRLATYGPGTAFGESELVDDRLHDNDVYADTHVEYHEIPLAALEVLAEGDPQLIAIVFRNIARKLAAQLHTASEDIQALLT